MHTSDAGSRGTSVPYDPGDSSSLFTYVLSSIIIFGRTFPQLHCAPNPLQSVHHFYWAPMTTTYSADGPNILFAHCFELIKKEEVIHSSKNVGIIWWH